MFVVRAVDVGIGTSVAAIASQAECQVRSKFGRFFIGEHVFAAGCIRAL